MTYATLSHEMSCSIFSCLLVVYVIDLNKVMLGCVSKEFL